MWWLQRAQAACCDEVQRLLPPPQAADRFEVDIVAMFQQEWALSGRSGPLRTIAIVDESPQSQFLYPEFELFASCSCSMVACRGVRPIRTALADGALRYQGEAIDMVYNRLTDFYLVRPAPCACGVPGRTGGAHAAPAGACLYADKRNLMVLSDASALQTMGLPAHDAMTLARWCPKPWPWGGQRRGPVA